MPAALPSLRYAYALSIGAPPRPGVARRIIGDKVVLFREPPGQRPGSATVAEVVGVAPPTVREIERMAGGILLQELVQTWASSNQDLVSKRRAELEAIERRALIAGLVKKKGARR